MRLGWGYLIYPQAKNKKKKWRNSNFGRSRAGRKISKNKTQTAVTNMKKQHMLQKAKILKTWRFVCNNIHLQKWQLKRLK